MKLKTFLLSFILLLSGFLLFSYTKTSFNKAVPRLRDGDIIFQTSQSDQCKAVQAATHSIYSHCGIIFLEGDKIKVYEAVQPVRVTGFDEWISHGKGKKYVIKRLKNADSVLTPATLSKMKESAIKHNGKNYDIYFGWSDERIYCSELVWKIYKEGAGLEVGKLQKLKEFDLSHPEVKRIMKERYGNNVPLEETVISPASVFASELLITVAEN
ncbi:MAG: YiiX family permuted papain-like enzyme [Bacteroidota bacterium]|nr:YiiX family permuted papain-like enzyme [Bacteroidota bacterium]